MGEVDVAEDRGSVGGTEATGGLAEAVAGGQWACAGCHSMSPLAMPLGYLDKFTP